MPTKSLAHFTITIDGQNASPDFMSALTEVVVDTSLYMPDMFTILLQDSALEWVDSALLSIGKTVEIKAQLSGDRGGHAGALTKGEITALEPDFSDEGKTTLLVRGYDRSHRLHRGKLTRTFTNQTDKNIVEKIAGEVGLKADVDGTGITYDYVLQNTQTNMEFLLTRAQRIGYQVYTADETLYFKKGEAKLGTGPELALGDSLRSFRPRWTTTHQADKVTVRGWDAKGKQVITSQVTPSSRLNQGGMQQTGGAVAQGAFGSAEAVVTNQPVFSVDEAQALAQGLSYDIGREFVQAEGVCLGDPGVKAGVEISVVGVGNRFKGKYFVTWATHVYNEDGYETTFSISGRQPNTLSHLLGAGNDQGSAQGTVRGMVTGLVTNLNDPDELGRVKVKYAWLGDDIESDWARIAAPMAGAERGFYYLPEVNDEVLIAFEHGDVHHPYIVGALWNSKDKPPGSSQEVIGDGKVNQRILKSRSGHEVILDDTDGEEKITIKSKSGHIVTFSDASGGEKISVCDKTGQNKVEIDSNSNSLTIDTGQNVTINAGQDLMLKANSKIDIQATQVAINGSTKVDVKGGMINLN